MIEGLDDELAELKDIALKFFRSAAEGRKSSNFWFNAVIQVASRFILGFNESVREECLRSLFSSIERETKIYITQEKKEPEGGGH